MAIEITIISAKHLKNVNWRNGDLTPYVAVSLDTRSFSTRPDYSCSTRPVWNEPFRFPIPTASPSPQFLSLEVFHSGRPDVLVGSVQVPIRGLEGPTRVHTLELRRPSGRPHGKIRVKLGLVATPPPVPVRDYRFDPSVSDCYSFTPRAPSVSLPFQGFSPLVKDCLLTPGVSCNYDSAPPVSNFYDLNPSVSDCRSPTHRTVSGLWSPQVEDGHFIPEVSCNYDFARSVTDCYRFTPPVARPTVSCSLPPQRFSGPVEDYVFTPSVLFNYDSATVTSQRPGSWQSSGQVQDCDFSPSVPCNYGSATAPAFPGVVCSPPPQQLGSLQVKDHDFSPSVPYNYDSATALPARSPLQPRRSSLQAQDYSFSPSVSCNYDSATAAGSLPGRQSSGQAQDYNFSPPVSCNYDSATVTGSRPPQQSSGLDCDFSPQKSCNYDSATGTGSLLAQQSSGQAQYYNFSPLVSCNNDSATAPPVPSPLPPHQSGSLPAQQCSGQSQDYNFTPPISCNYNSTTATPQRHQTYPPPQPESTIPLPPQHSSSQACDNIFTPPSLRDHDTAPPPAYPFPRPQQYVYCQGYPKPLRPDLRQGNYGGEQPSAPVDYNAQYYGDNVKGNGCFGDKEALTWTMRGMALVESDLGSTSDDSKSSRSYKAQPSAPVIRRGDDYGMF